MEAKPLPPAEHRAISYAYQPLDHATQTIRLIRLQPASSFDSDVYCDIHHVSLDTHPEYEAISYAWGDAAITAPIFLQGCPFQATTNLVSALRHLRYQDRERVLWVDAICIDQSNVQERGHQVAFMARIYSSAKCDLLWLGDDPANEADMVFKFILKMVRFVRYIADDYRLTSRNKELKTAASIFLKETPLSALQHIFKDRPVWSRIWVVQEIVVSRSISIHCGPHSMPWGVLDHFFSVMGVLMELYHRQAGLISIATKALVAMLPSSDIEVFRDGYSTSHRSDSLLDVWCQFCNLEATNPCDKIFAFRLLGLATPLSITADYAKPELEIFTEVVRSSISQDQNLNALCLGCREKSNPTFPSWVPDFGDREAFNGLGPGRSTPEDLLYHSWIEDSASLDSVCFSETDPTMLVLCGVQLDDSLKTYPLRSFAFRNWNDIGDMMRALGPDFFLKRRYHTGESMWTACARTFTGDVGFTQADRRQNVEESESLARDLKSTLSWKGRFGDRMWPLTTSQFDSIALNRLRRRESKQPMVNIPLPGFFYYKFSATSKGFIGMVPDTSEESDILCILKGSKVPHVLRKVPGREDTYTLVGIAYVHGFMYGEVVEWIEQGKLKEQKFNLI